MEEYFKVEKYLTSEEIFYEDAGVVTLLNKDLRYLLAEILTRIPGEIVKHVYHNCLFLIPKPEEKACYISNRITEDKHIILFHSDLFNWPKEEQINVILNEIAHYFLGHKSTLEGSVVDWKQQEKEADALRDKWLAEWSRVQSMIRK
jgi:hypothetical protein